MNPLRVVRLGRLYLAAIADIRRAARDVYGEPWVPMYLRAVRLRRAHGFAIDESLAQGLLDRRRRVDDRIVSKRELLRAQALLNPAGIEPLIENKAILYHVLELAGVPVPRMLALLTHGGHSWNWYTSTSVEPDGWAATLDTMPDRIVVKPALGYHGRSVCVLARDGDRWRDAAGGHRDSRELAHALADDPEFATWVVQERVENHPDMACFGAPGVVNTLRVVTFVDRNGEVGVEWVGFRIGSGGAGIDNFGGGRNNNLSVNVDHRTGTLIRAIAAHPSGIGIRDVREDPVTGTVLAGRTLPMWDEVRALSLRTAEALLPARTVGLDVAITPGGPTIIEANMWWDPPPQEPLRPLLERLLRD